MNFSFGRGLLLSLCFGVCELNSWLVMCLDSREMMAQPGIHTQLTEKFASSQREGAGELKADEEN